MRTVLEYIQYFRALGDYHPGIQYVVHGDSPRIINESRTRLRYPCLWIETPDIEVINEGLVFTGGIVVLKNAKLNSQALEDAALEETFHIMQGIIARIRQDADIGMFSYDSMRMDNISTLTHDNDYGWRLTVRLTREQAKCCEDCINDEAPTPFFAAFQFTNWNYGGGPSSAPTFTNKSISPAGATVSYLWEWWDSNYPGVVLDQEGAPPLPGDAVTYINPGDFLVMRLTMTYTAGGNNYVSKAQARIPSGNVCGWSIPDPVEIVISN